MHRQGRPWEKLGGQVVGGPDAATWAPGRLDVFLRGTDNALYHKWFDGSWHGYEGLGGTLGSDPSAVSWGPNRIDVFARSTTSTLLHKWYDGQTWSTGGKTLGERSPLHPT